MGTSRKDAQNGLRGPLWLGDLRPLPETVRQDGREWRVETRARGVLRILRMLEDEDVAPAHKGALLVRWFYPDGAPPEPVEPFRAFVGAGCAPDEADGGPRDFDYEQDAAEIVASFQQLYGLDLLGADGCMHWWRFRALLAGCFASDCALSAKVRLRRMDPGKADASTRAAIARVQLDTRESAQERRMAEEVARRLAAGLPVDELLGGLEE